MNRCLFVAISGMILIEPAAALDLGIGANAGRVSTGTSIGVGRNGVSVGVGMSAGGSGVNAGTTVGKDSAGASVGKVDTGVSVGKDKAGLSVGATGSSTAGGISVGAGSGISGGKAPGAKSGVASGATPNAARSTSSAAKALGGSISATKTKGTVPVAALAPTLLPKGAQPIVELPPSLRPAFGSGRSTADALATIEGTPSPVVRTCRDAIEAAATEFGDVHVQAKSAGTPRELAGGNLSAPLQVRVQYARPGGPEIRQARIKCQLDATGRVVKLT